MRRAALAAALAAAALNAQAAIFNESLLPLRQLKWLQPGAGQLAALTSAPPECRRAPADPAQAALAEAGRIVFRTPTLLGGLAAKGGLSCQSCHVNGHGNPQFFIAGLSDRPGHFDVSSSVFSKRRGDGVFNPKSIPSLLDVLARADDGYEARKQRIGAFIRGVVVEEFDGAPPAPVVFDALLSYVASLDRGACPPSPQQAITLDGELATIRRGGRALDAALERDDRALADFLVVGLRSLLGSVDERFQRPGLEAQRARLRALSMQLSTIRQTLAHDTARAHASLQRWHQALDAAAPLLLARAADSYYEPWVLEAALRAAQPRRPNAEAP